MPSSRRHPFRPARLASAVALASTCTVSHTALAQLEEVIVTAQKRLESAQDVPIAVTAFDAGALEAKQINGFADIRFTAPNVTYSKGNFTGNNFQIRGIGTTLVAASSDQGVGIHVNEVPINYPRLFETEYYDVQAVEVLRGPQGTLYGRNATGGSVNMTTARAEVGEFLGNVEGQYGDWDHTKVVGHVNIPVSDSLAVRFAGLYLERDGYTDNVYTGNDVDGRDQYSVRGSLTWLPTEQTTIELMVSYFDEDSDRSRSTKTMCRNDPTGLLGCEPDGLDFDLPNPSSQLANILASDFILGPLGIFELGSNERPASPNDLRKTISDFEPVYEADETLVTLVASHELDSHTLHLVAGYQDTEVESEMDYQWSVAAPVELSPFLPILFPETYNALYFDGQLPISARSANGTGSIGGHVKSRINSLESYDNSYQTSEQYSLELRIQSDYDGRFNWLAGAFWMDVDIVNGYYVFASGFDYLAGIAPAAAGFDGLGWVAPQFLSDTDKYTIESRALFGEVYYDLSETLKLTLGLRYTEDEKEIRDRQLLFNSDEATGVPFYQPIGADQPIGVPYRDDDDSWEEFTGRAVIDWQFADDSMVYASYSRGYKGGGFNPPFDPLLFPNSSPTFEPEFVDAFEIGTKNVFFDGTLQANGTLFYYDYEDLQVSRIVNRTSFNENTDAEIFGVEAELVWAPNERWLFNGNFAYLKTEIQDFESIDSRDPTAGSDQVTLVKDLGSAANCVAEIPPALFNALVPPAAPGLSPQFSSCDALAAAGIPITDGIQENLEGNQLQNSPEYSVSLGAQYTFYLPQDHTLAVRVDYYWQDEMYARNFNKPVDKIEDWDVWNAQATLMSANESWYARAYIKNIANDDHLVGMYLTDPSSGLFTNVFTIEPRTYGLALGYNF
jgi:outer membrane receptor protein involved in Fe transport